MTLTDKLYVAISMQAINMIEVFWSCCRASLSHAEEAINISGVTAISIIALKKKSGKKLRLLELLTILR